MSISLIAAMTINRVIGGNNKLLWHYPEDMRYFSKTTTGHTVVMGRKTRDSLPEKFRPLPNRRNIVLSKSRKINGTQGVECFDSIENLLDALKKDETEIFVIGGGNIYQQFLPYADKLYITEIRKKYKGDTYFPQFKKNFKEVSRDNYDQLSFVVYEKINQ